MAPELYDEIYNEKVDIYAFGMLLLEIITRDVPYHECTNPAQIYKKVTQGIPPPSLHRIKSIDARNFILLCLGIGEDANARPSASDLLKHQFLAKNTDDEMTIELEPAVEDMIIEEGDPSSMTFSDDSIGSGEPIRKLDGIDEMINNESSIPSQAPIEPSEKGPQNDITATLSKQVSDPLECRDSTTQPTANLEDEQMDDQYGEWGGARNYRETISPQSKKWIHHRDRPPHLLLQLLRLIVLGIRILAVWVVHCYTKCGLFPQQS